MYTSISMFFPRANMMSSNPRPSMAALPANLHVVAPFTVVACSLLVLAFLHYLATKTTATMKRELHRLPPGPAGLPIIGSVHHLMYNKPVFRWIHRLVKEMNTKIMCLRFGPVHVIVVNCPEIAREVMRKNDAVFASRPLTFASSSFSFGYKGSILSPYGEQWKKMRRVMTSEILSPALERRLHARRAEEADHLVRFVYNQCNDTKANNGVDIRHVARHFCGDMIRKLVFSKRYFVEPPLVSAGAGPGPNEVEHVDALFTLVNCVYSFCISDYFPVLRGGLDLDGHEKVVHGVMATLNRLHDPIIEERIHEWSILRKHGEKREIQDFLDVLVSLEDSEGQALLSFEEIKAQAAEIMFAIVDNPSNAVEWALAEMMNKPEVMEKAMNELNTVVGKERLVQESDIPRLNYLKSCIREAFRLHPYHAFNVPHVAMKDTTLSGYTIPKDSHVIISRVGLGRNPDIWDAPLEFQPERHLSGSSDVLLTEPDLRFISFGTGRRGCPGVSLGSFVTMMLFARLLQGFTWTKLPGVRAIELKESTTSLALSEPLILQAEPRLPVHLYESISS
ncbi:hypothetical protein HU200_045471 [Digitaria exilis]|uniref:Cytochrome P450 n=1 Tax=Digitaria exilis TaxID=1010633 RepID=A0A835AY37_9POAL|nr:hypothetical protein HU200_045471 [Digitaria exilis]